jgi:hypothetical protein
VIKLIIRIGSVREISCSPCFSSLFLSSVPVYVLKKNWRMIFYIKIKIFSSLLFLFFFLYSRLVLFIPSMGTTIRIKLNHKTTLPNRIVAYHFRRVFTAETLANVFFKAIFCSHKITSVPNQYKNSR